MNNCCRLDQEFIAGIVRNRSGVYSGLVDYQIRTNRMEKLNDNDLLDAIYATKEILRNLENILTASK